MDITLVESDCDNGDVTIRVHTAAGMIDDAPDDYDESYLQLQPNDGGPSHWFDGGVDLIAGPFPLDC